jgi:hypothetical protein
MKRSYGLFFALLTLAFTSTSCHVNDKGDASIDDCDGDLLQAYDHTTLSELTGGHSSWSTETPLAAGDCTTLYYVWFRYFGTDNQKDPNPPAVSFDFIPTTGGLPPSPQQFGGTPPGAPGKGGWWLVSFAPTPNSETGNKTQYRIYAKLKDNAIDDVEVYTQISYRHSPN